MTSQLKMIVSVELVGMDRVPRRCEIANIERSVDGARLADFGLSLDESKEMQRRVQEELTQLQTNQAAQRDRKCQDCNRCRELHDYRSRTIHSLFGSCRVRVPRWRSCECSEHRCRVADRSEAEDEATRSLLNGGQRRKSCGQARL